MMALSCGDEAQSIYHELGSYDFIVGSIITYSWLFISTTFVINIFLSIVEDGYVDQQTKPRYKWLTDYYIDPDHAFDMEEPDAPSDKLGDKFLSLFKDAKIVQSGLNS